MNISKTKNKVEVILSVLLSLLFVYCLLSPIAFATDDDDTVVIDVNDIDDIAVEDGDEIEIAVAAPDNGEGSPTANTDDSKNDDEETESTGTTKTETTTTTVEEITEDGRTYKNGAFTVDGNGHIQDIISDGTKEFYVITTANGGVFYLLIDRAGDFENVYFLSAVDETDIQDFVVSGYSNYDYGTTTSTYNSSTTTTTTTYDENGNIVYDEEYIEEGNEGEVVEESSSGSSYTGIIIILVIIVVVVFVVLIWRSMRKNRANRNKGEDETQGLESDDMGLDDDEDEDDDF